jgi:DNA-binding response OmpR family regulator
VQILLVDDHIDTADSLGLLLRRRGHDVHIARDGKRGLEAASALAPDAVLLDLGLPDLDGSEIARQLRSGPRGAELLLVAVSGRTSAELPGEISALFDALLRKPVEIGALFRVLETSKRDGGQKATPGA